MATLLVFLINVPVPSKPSCYFTVNFAVLDTPFAVAETVTVVVALTGFVPTGNVALAVSALTVTVEGIDEIALDPAVTANVTIVSCARTAGNVTFPVVVVPPVTIACEKDRPEGIIAVTVKAPVLVSPFKVAEKVTFTPDESCTV